MVTVRRHGNEPSLWPIGMREDPPDAYEKYRDDVEGKHGNDRTERNPRGGTHHSAGDCVGTWCTHESTRDHSRGDHCFGNTAELGGTDDTDYSVWGWNRYLTGL